MNKISRMSKMRGMNRISKVSKMRGMKGMREGKKIRFTDSRGRELFALPDGGLLQMTYGNGEDYFVLCYYLNDSWVSIDGKVYDILEFARRMEKNGIDYAPA